MHTYDKKKDRLDGDTKKTLKMLEGIRRNTECLFKDINITCDSNKNSKTKGNHLFQKAGYLERIVLIIKFGCRLLLSHIKNAHKYNVLCGNHNKDLFSAIENGKEFCENDKQQCFNLILGHLFFIVQNK